MYQLPCPCGLGLYTHCCQPLHLGLKTAETAQQLMRSRYSAFALQQINYIVKTTALRQQPVLNVVALGQWSQENRWLRLEIIQVNEKLDKQHAQVEFKAYYHHDGQSHIHHEISNFVRFQTHWYFLDPTLDQSWPMKHACICGSDKKFKQCCAHFL